MKILFVSSRVPFPPLHGDQVRAWNFLKRLSRKHQITLVTPLFGYISQEVEPEVRGVCHQWVRVHVSHVRRLVGLRKYFSAGWPLQTVLFCPHKLCRTVWILAASGKFDILHVQLARVAPVVFGIDMLPKIIDFIDALSLNMFSRAEKQHGLLSWIFKKEGERMAALEAETVRNSDRQLISSRRDKAAIGEFDTIHVVPNGVDTQEFRYVEHSREDRMIVFTGHMSYSPNVDAAAYFVDHVFPLVRVRVPDAIFFIVGAHPTARVRALGRQPGVVVTGAVPRVQDYLCRATVAVAPIRVGSGLQFKVLEAMACGAPVVATSVAAQAIDAVDGDHLMIADDPITMADQIIELLRSPGLRRRIARNARKLIEEKYTWEQAVAKVEEVYRLARGG
jgi:sugar transferase (PEP-CTERM/EpsH1 system associated)